MPAAATGCGAAGPVDRNRMVTDGLRSLVVGIVSAVACGWTWVRDGLRLVARVSARVVSSVLGSDDDPFVLVSLPKRLAPAPAPAPTLLRPPYPRVGLLDDVEAPACPMQRHCPDTKWNHLERPERLEVIRRALTQAGFADACVRIPVRAVGRDELLLAYGKDETERVDDVLSGSRLVQRMGFRRPVMWGSRVCPNSPDNYMNHDTPEAVRTACGSTVALVDAILTGRIDRGYAVVRPPGHHASGDRMAGFCFLNNAAVTALYAVAKYAGERVMIVDFDLHESDGTRALVQDKTRVALFSIHRWDHGRFYPFTQDGRSGWHGQNVLYHGYDGVQDGAYYRRVFRDELAPFCRHFRPTLMIVSAGFDAACGEPVHVVCRGAQQTTAVASLTAAAVLSPSTSSASTTTNVGTGGGVDAGTYYDLVRQMRTWCPRVALVLEGGYNADNLAQCSVACMHALCENVS